MTNSKSPVVTRVLMCRPTHFSVDFVINPYMSPGSVDGTKAMSQWESLLTALESQAIKVEIIEQKEGLPDMVFATDQGIVQKDKVVLANFQYDERKEESVYYEQWFNSNGFKVERIDESLSFEAGGNTQFLGDILFVGTGFRAKAESCSELSKLLGIDVLPLQIVDPFYYHLDTCLLTIDSETAFYYPPAFDKDSSSLLKKMVKNLYELTKVEAESFAANSFVSGNTVFIQANLPAFKTKLESLGKKVIEVDASEFKKAGGGIHCLINPLEK